MGPIWGHQDQGGPHVSPMNFAIWDVLLVVSKKHRRFLITLSQMKDMKKYKALYSYKALYLYLDYI